MEYLALYRKYRPSALEEMVGQSEIRKIIASSIKNGTISHAYLFSGPRGTGKTTTAKIKRFEEIKKEYKKLLY